jgi:IMP dehydrogenase
MVIMVSIDKRIGKVGLTYDDILLIVKYSDIDPTKVNVETQLTENIKLKVPILSAAMDTVTEAKMAIALALEGGLGVIHRNMTPEQQAWEVAKVKRFESGFVENPETLSPRNTLADAREINKKYSGIPITQDGTNNSKLVGLITSKDFYFDDPDSNLIKNYMTPFEDLVVDIGGITLERANKRLKESKKGMVLLIDTEKNRKLISIVCRKDLEKNYLYPNACKDENKRLRVAGAVGPSDVKIRAKALVDSNVDALVIDTVAGNVATPAGVKSLKSAGANAIKVGVGPGAICTTRVVAGVGVPQATAVLECVKAAGKTSIIADGGIKYSGDIAKAIGLGASAVMIGSLFAGTDEAPGETYITEDHRVFKSYRGMGSVGAMQRGSADRYGQKVQESKLTNKLVPEGIEGMVPAIGPLKDHVYQLIGGLRQAMGYVGARNITEFQDKAEFIRSTTGTAQKESHPRVPIVKRAPNYPTDER